MGEDKETKSKLLDSAKREFLEKGYMKASLRTICKNVGVTTGALYFFFQDKEDLLKQLVEAPLQGLIAIIKAHLSEEMRIDVTLSPAYDNAEDIKTAIAVVHFMYQNHDIFEILLNKSQGSVYENIVSRFTDWGEQHYNVLAELAAAKMGVPKLNQDMLRWLVHMQVDAFVYLFTHEPDEEKALKQIEEITAYMVSGWKNLILAKK